MQIKRWRCVRLRIVKCYAVSFGTRKWEHAISICCFHYHCVDFVCGDSGNKHQTRSQTTRIHNEQQAFYNTKGKHLHLQWRLIEDARLSQ